jgi:hypothetical protein
MAKITFSLEELVQILISNKLLPAEIIRVRVAGERIHFVIRTSSFIVPFVPASLRFLSFDGSNAVCELAIVSSRVSRAASWLSQMFKIKIPAYVKLDYPKIFVDVDKLLKQKNIRGVRVKDILLEEGELTIVTCNV